MSKHHDDWDSIETAQDALTRLFREMLYDYDINYATLKRLLKWYLDNLPPDVDRQKRANLNTNTLGALGKDRMTMDMFCKALRILQAHQVDLYVVVHRGDGKTLHHTGIDLGDPVEQGLLLSRNSQRVVDPNMDVLKDLIQAEHPDAVVSEHSDDTLYPSSVDRVRTRAKRKPRRPSTPDDQDDDGPDASANAYDPF